jgi:hypothetical protein
VSSYTITIIPDDDSATATTLRLDTSHGDVKLTDLHLHAGGGLSNGVLPAIDYGLLLRAITPTTPTPIGGTRAQAPAEPVAARSRPGRGGGVTSRPSANANTTRGTVAGRAKTAKATTARKSTRAAAGSERAYRRMPDDFAAVYRQAGTASAVADHYNVPRHTAHGWIRRLRGQAGAPTSR